MQKTRELPCALSYRYRYLTAGALPKPYWVEPPQPQRRSACRPDRRPVLDFTSSTGSHPIPHNASSHHKHCSQPTTLPVDRQVAPKQAISVQLEEYNRTTSYWVYPLDYSILPLETDHDRDLYRRRTLYTYICSFPRGDLLYIGRLRLESNRALHLDSRDKTRRDETICRPTSSTAFAGIALVYESTLSCKI